MKITEVKTFLMERTTPAQGQLRRNWLFLKVFTDEGIHGVGEASGWPRVVETAIHDLSGVLVGEDPTNIEKLSQKLRAAILSGHGETGVVGGGAVAGIEMALWDIKGKVLNTPLWNLLGGKLRDAVHLYAHASSPERAQELVDRGYDALKMFGGAIDHSVAQVEAVRREVGDEVELMYDAGSDPWLTVGDAIRLGKALEDYHLLFLEEPVGPGNLEAMARVADMVDIPIAAGEHLAGVDSFRELIEREIIGGAQPDTGRAGGLSELKKIAMMAEAHFITVAPHDGTLGPVAEMAVVHLLASLPNFLILEHVADDTPQRYEVMEPHPEIVEGRITVPDRPGIGVDIVEDAIAGYPPTSDVISGQDNERYAYFEARSPEPGRLRRVRRRR